MSSWTRKNPPHEGLWWHTWHPTWPLAGATLLRLRFILTRLCVANDNNTPVADIGGWWSTSPVHYPCCFSDPDCPAGLNHHWIGSAVTGRTTCEKCGMDKVDYLTGFQDQEVEL